VSLDGTVAVLVASTTGAGALGPLAESFDSAVNGALVDVAFAGLDTSCALFASSFRRNRDATGALGGTTTAGLGALGPGTPSLQLAVNGTLVLVALGSLLEDRALFAAVGGSDFNGAVALTAATTTGTSAGGPLVPLRDFAVDGTGLGVAGLDLLKILAALATVGRRLGDLAGALLVASAAGTGALAELGPLGNDAVDGVVLDDGAKVSINPLGLIAFGTAVVVDYQVEGLGALHGEGRTGGLLTRALVLGPFLDTVDECLEDNTVAAVAIGVVEASAESECIVLLAKRVNEVGVGVRENTVVVTRATNLETAVVPGLVNHVGTPADGLVVGGKGTQLLAFNNGVFPEFGVHPLRLVTELGLLVIGFEGKFASVLGIDRETDGLLAGNDRARPDRLVVNDDRELNSVTTVAFRVIQTDTRAEHNEFLLQVISNFGRGVGENSVSVLLAANVEALGVPVAVHLVRAPADGLVFGDKVSEEGVGDVGGGRLSRIVEGCELDGGSER
jgi:hypothetical protein